jgi:hypothetical protein
MYAIPVRSAVNILAAGLIPKIVVSKRDFALFKAFRLNPLGST